MMQTNILYVGDTVQFNPDRFPLSSITRNYVCKKDTCQDVTNQEATCAHDWELVDKLTTLWTFALRIYLYLSKVW